MKDLKNGIFHTGTPLRACSEDKRRQKMKLCKQKIEKEDRAKRGEK